MSDDDHMPVEQVRASVSESPIVDFTQYPAQIYFSLQDKTVLILDLDSGEWFRG